VNLAGIRMFSGMALFACSRMFLNLISVAGLHGCGQHQRHPLDQDAFCRLLPFPRNDWRRLLGSVEELARKAFFQSLTDKD